MREVKVSELTDAALDWAVAKCKNQYVETRVTGRQNTSCRFGLFYNQRWVGAWERWDEYTPSTDWAQGGPIIEREINNLFKQHQIVGAPATWTACKHIDTGTHTALLNVEGPTPLIAAMRCYVASKMGDTINVPDELL